MLNIETISSCVLLLSAAKTIIPFGFKRRNDACAMNFCGRPKRIFPFGLPSTGHAPSALFRQPPLGKILLFGGGSLMRSSETGSDTRKFFAFKSNSTLET